MCHANVHEPVVTKMHVTLALILINLEHLVISCTCYKDICAQQKGLRIFWLHFIQYWYWLYNTVADQKIHWDLKPPVSEWCLCAKLSNKRLQGTCLWPAYQEMGWKQPEKVLVKRSVLIVSMKCVSPLTANFDFISLWKHLLLMVTVFSKGFSS